MVLSASPVALSEMPIGASLISGAVPASTPGAGGPPPTDPGLILVVVVIPVVLVALIWLGYIFWLIFHEGENIGSGSPPPPKE